jgi:hypothetical protein
MADRSGEFAVETSTFARLIAFNPYQEALSFQLSSFRRHATDLDSSQSGGRYFSL